MWLERRSPTKLEELEGREEQSDSDTEVEEFHAPEEEMHWIMQPPTWSWVGWRGQVGFFMPLEMPAVSMIQNFGMLRQSGILSLEASMTQHGTEQHSHQAFAVHASPSHRDDSGDHPRNVTLKSTNLVGGKQERRKPFWRAPTTFREALSSLWPRISNRVKRPHRENDSPMLTAPEHFTYPAGTDLPVPDMQLFILDFFRAGITLIHGIVRALLSSPSRRATTFASAFQNLREEEISNALERWQSISQTSLIKLDSCTPTPAELMQSWTAINENLELTYNDRPIWPFKSWFADTWKSTSASYVISRCLSRFLDTHIQSSQAESWVMAATRRRFDCLQNFALTRQNSLSFFTYSTPADGLTTSHGQLFKPSLKSSGLMTTAYGLACNLETLQFSTLDRVGGEIIHPVTAVSINRHSEGPVSYNDRVRGLANPENYAGVLFDYEERILPEAESFEPLMTMRLLLLSCTPPSSGPGMPRPEIWNMMLVKPVENGFYGRVAVGRFRKDVLMLLNCLNWSYNYIRLA